MQVNGWAVYLQISKESDLNQLRILTSMDKIVLSHDFIRGWTSPQGSDKDYCTEISPDLRVAFELS